MVQAMLHTGNTWSDRVAWGRTGLAGCQQAHWSRLGWSRGCCKDVGARGGGGASTCTRGQAAMVLWTGGEGTRPPPEALEATGVERALQAVGGMKAQEAVDVERADMAEGSK